MIGLLLTLLIFCVFIWVANAILSAFGIGDPIRTVVYVIIVLFALAYLLQLVGAGVGGVPHGWGFPIR